MKKVAVYGTLRQGCYNNPCLGAGSIYKGTKKISGFRMFEACKAFPCISRGDGTIVVELYDNADIKQLDVLESEGVLYSRQTETIDGEDYYIYVFCNPTVRLKPIPGGDWVEHKTQDYRIYY